MNTIGKYEVLGELGKGGFGTVYRGRDTQLKRLVAIKVCSSDSENIRARFQREAEIVASLHHPNITIIYDLGVHEGLPYLVQELLSGEDLSGPIERQDEVPLDRKLEILADVARGLEHAHAHEIIHRDIKPGNIRLLADGSVKVMDFGIAKLASFETKLTKTGMMVGTAAYLAPEQIDDAAIDARCDIFSYGVLAYELLSYQRPFDASTVSALLYQILHRPHPPLHLRSPQCPPRLAALVDRCLEKDREKRPQSFSEIRSELAELGAGTGPIARPATSRGDGAATRPVSGSTERTTVASGSLAAPAGVHAAETRAYESGSTPVIAAALRMPAAQPVPDIPTIPLGSVPEFARRRSPWPRLAAAAALVLALGAAGWFAMSSRRSVAAVPAEVAAGEAPATGLTDPSAASSTATPVPAATVPEGTSTPTTDPTEQVTAPPAGAGAAGAVAPASPPERRPAEPERNARTEPAPRPSASATTRPADRPSASGTAATASRPEVAAAPDRRSPPPETAPGAATATPPTPNEPSSRTGTATPPVEIAGVRVEAATPPAAEPPPPVTRAAPPAPVDHEPAIRRALDRYRQAYEQLDARLLVDVWPTLGRDELARIERSFQSFESVQVAIEACRIAVEGERATASCQVQRTLKPKAGRLQTVDQQTTFRLARRADGWVIEGL